MKFRAPGLFALVALPLTAGFAQTGDERASIALRASHIGALTPLLSPAMISRRLNGAQLGVRYGLLDEAGFTTHAVAGSGIFAAGLKSSVTLTAGVSDADCTGCSPAMILGLGGDTRVFETADGVGSASSLSVAVSGEFAYAQLKPGDDYAIALGVGAPITWSLGGATEGMRFAPFFTPVFGIGQTSTECPTGCDKSGTRWVLGGGIGVWNPLTSVSVSVGINRVMRRGANPVYGINVVLGGR